MTMRYEYVDLGEQYRRLRQRMDAAVLEVLERGEYIMGPQVAQLEEKLAAYVGVEHCVTTSSGTDALLLCLMASGIGPGDGVITSPFSFFATAEVISLVGATPIFCDIDDTYNLSPSCLEETIAHCRRSRPDLRLRAVMPVDLYGLAADYDSIVPICEANGLELIADAAQSFGASMGGRMAGSFGRYGCTSFFPAKPLGCYGDGGAIFTHSDEDGALLRSLRIHGMGENKYQNLRIGLGARMDTLQAAVLLTKLEVFDWELSERQRVAGLYTSLLGDVVKTPIIPPGRTSSYAQYTIALPGRAQRDALKAELLERGIPTNIYYPTPIHLQQAYSSLPPQTLPRAEAACGEVLSLPMHPYLEDSQVEDIARCIREIVAKS